LFQKGAYLMNENHRELLEIVAQVRGHLEYQRALGVRTIAVPSFIGESADNGEKNEITPTSRVANGKREIKQNPSLGKILEDKIASAGSSSLESVREEMGDCIRCRLYQGRKTLVFGEGSRSAKLVFVGEGPGYEEDQQGRPFVGEAGQLLTDIIVKGMKLAREEVYICNVVKCRPPGNRTPAPDEIAACEPFLREQLQAIKPSVIVTLGNVPTQTLLKTKEGITKLRGKWREFEGIPLMPTFHPAYLLRNPKDKVLVWEDIKKVIVQLEKNT
jgi:uracil-DNA glycosylase family 4